MVNSRLVEFKIVVIKKNLLENLFCKIVVLGKKLSGWNFLLTIKYEGNKDDSAICTWHSGS